MSFTGNGGGRFQIRRIRNGSTAECFVTANGPFQQTFNEPQDRHFPNWNFADSSTNTFNAGTSYAAGTIVVFGTGDNEGLYRARITTITVPPTLNDTNANWEFIGPEGDPLEITPQLLVNGIDINRNGTRAASPVNAAITDIQWQVSTGTTFVDVDTALDGFELTGTTLNGTGTVLRIDRNLDVTTNFNPGALMNGALTLRAVIEYNITGVTDAAGANQTLTCNAMMVVSRQVLTESSMFSQIRLIDTTPTGQPSNGSASQIWNSGFRTDKTLRVDLFIGANNVAADATGITGLTFQWSNTNGTIAGAVARDLTVDRDDVNTAETYFCTVTEVESGDTFVSNSLELRDFLDPIQFQEVGTATVDAGAMAMLTVIPYQNGAPMIGLTATNTVYSFEYRRQSSATDMTGTRLAWDTGFALASRFPANATGRAYAADTNPVLANGIARVGHDTTVMGATIVLTGVGNITGFTDNSGEVGPFGAFIDYDVTFTMVGN